MSREKSIELIEGFCALTGIKDPESIVRDGSVTVNGVTFSLIHNEEIDPKSLAVYADFGQLPSKRELEVCMGLMEANLFLSARKLPVFGISPATRNVTLVARCELDELTPEKLRDALSELAAKAREWRKDHFLDLKPKPPAKRGNFEWAMSDAVKS
jgi:ABC-type phosphate/phosphonate transport system substrate-binding protein